MAQYKVTCAICRESWTDRDCVISPRVDGYFHLRDKHPELLEVQLGEEASI
jgi:hypothetical protein